MKASWASVVAVASIALASIAAASNPPVDTARITAADHEPGNWLSVGRDYGDQRYSPLNSIKADNVAQLGLAWFHDLDTAKGQEATPLVIDGVLYTSTAWSIVKAYDARSGRPLWTYDPAVPRPNLPKVCCDAVNRGIAAWNNKIYVGTLDSRLVALNAATGTPIWDVVTVDQSKAYSITQAPLVVNGRVLIGNSGGEFGVRGYISAYDAETGKLDWRFYTVPGDPASPFENDQMKNAAKTWKGKWWANGGGGGTVWGGISYDPTLDLIYFGTGNGADWPQNLRSPGGGDNLFVSSIVAVKSATGAYVWHYQATPGDEWDFDATQDLMLADLTLGGQPRKVLMQADKNGFFYVLDRATGKLLSAKSFAPTSWAKGIDIKTGRPIENPAARYDKTGKLFANTPGPAGAHNWQPTSFNPTTGLVYIPAQETTFPFKSLPSYKNVAQGFNLGLDLAAVSMPADPKVRAAALAGENGSLIAWDPVKQTQKWRVDYPGPWNGGTLTTAGNLVFQGDAAGNFLAYRADDGTKLWSMEAQSAVMAGPMTFAVDGAQYVAVLAGWGGAFTMNSGILAGKSGNERNISRIMVFKLGGTVALPPARPEMAAVLDPPASTADAATLQTGKELFAQFCSACHGDAAVSGHVVPDLRYSASLKDDSWFDIVLNGSLKDEGMVAWTPMLDRSKASAVRAYVIKRANEDKALEAKSDAAPPPH